MSIFLNGSSNPSRVFFNGTEVDRVYATVDGVPSVFPVWEKAMIFPEELGQVTVTMSDGCKAYFRNPKLIGAFHWSSGGTGADYSCNVTIETSFVKGKQIGPTLPYTTPYYWYGEGSYQSATGLPSGYSFYQGYSADSASTTVAFDVYKWTTPGVLRESEKVAMNLQTQITISKSLGQRFVTQPHGNSWSVLTRATGWIYQGSGKLILSKD